MYILVLKISRDIYLSSLLTVQQVHQIDITKQGNVQPSWGSNLEN